MQYFNRPTCVDFAEATSPQLVYITVAYIFMHCCQSTTEILRCGKAEWQTIRIFRRKSRYTSLVWSYLAYDCCRRQVMFTIIPVNVGDANAS